MSETEVIFTEAQQRRAVAMIKAALAEAGYPHAEVRGHERYLAVLMNNRLHRSKLEEERFARAWWKATNILVAPLFLGVPTCCWDCYGTPNNRTCDHDPRTT